MSDVPELPDGQRVPATGAAAGTSAAPIASQRIEAGLRDDQFLALQALLAKPRPFSDPDAVLKMVQTLAIVAAILWPMHDYFAYKREANQLELTNRQLEVQAAVSSQFSRYPSTELIDVPGSDQNGTHLFRVGIGVQVANNTPMYLQCHGVRLRLLLGTLKKPGAVETVARTNSPGHKQGVLAWQPLVDGRYLGTERVTDWNPTKVALDVPLGGTVDEVEGGLAFGQLAPRESSFGNDEFRIRAAKDSYLGVVIDYILEWYVMERQNGSANKKHIESEQHHLELVRNFAELGMRDEWGRPIETPRGGLEGAPRPLPPARQSTATAAPEGVSTGIPSSQE